jgi:hypothetical protein
MPAPNMTANIGGVGVMEKEHTGTGIRPRAVLFDLLTEPVRQNTRAHRVSGHDRSKSQPIRSLPTREAQAGIGHGDLAGHVSRCRAGEEHNNLGDVLRRGGDLQRHHGAHRLA